MDTTQAKIPSSRIFNIDFGADKTTPTKEVGPAAIGNPKDFWNSVAVSMNDDHTESGLRLANGNLTKITVRMVNLGGEWGNGGKMGVKDIMLDNFNYPKNNQGGNSQVILSVVPAGTYDLYLYGHGTDPVYYGDYTLTVGGRSYGRKATLNQIEAVESTKWVEKYQYVKFSNVTIKSSESVGILIQPGGQVSDGPRTFADAMICGLQLVQLK